METILEEEKDKLEPFSYSSYEEFKKIKELEELAKSALAKSNYEELNIYHKALEMEQEYLKEQNESKNTFKEKETKKIEKEEDKTRLLGDIYEEGLNFLKQFNKLTDKKFQTYHDNNSIFTEFDPDPIWFDDEFLFIPDPVIKDISKEHEDLKSLSLDDAQYIYGNLDYEKLLTEDDADCLINNIKGIIVYFKKPYLLKMEIEVNQLSGEITNLYEDNRIYVTKNILAFIQTYIK